MNNKLLSVLLLFLLITTSCSTKTAFVYQPSNIKLQKTEKIKKTIGIVYFEDKRGYKVENLFWLSFVPLSLGGPMN